MAGKRPALFLQQPRRVARRSQKCHSVHIMRLSCSNCLTEYEIPDAALAGRTRTLRCAHCGHQWQHEAAMEAAAGVVAAAEPEPEPEPAPVAEAAPEVTPETAAAWPETAWPDPAPPEPAADVWPVAAEPVAAPWPEVPVPPAYAGMSWPAAAPVAEVVQEPAPVRSFGEAVDEAAKAELAAAATREVAAPEAAVSEPEAPVAVAEDLPAPHVEDSVLTAPPDDPAPVAPHVEEPPVLTDADLRPGSDTAEADSFAALVSAARRNSLQFEPEPPPAPKRRPNKAALVIAIVLVVVAVVLIAHRGIMRVLPASTGLFHALGLH
jgi:predicted Zn finger-like uncharacterized protein